jgi:GNAT superfamily N-acetyltransferase
VTPAYYAFGIETRDNGKVVIGLEKILNMVDDIRPLHEQHYNETEVLYTDAPFDPDYDRYRKSEEAGSFVVFTVRRDGEMIGYLQYYVYRSMHSKNVLQAKEDALFLSKSARGRGLAPAFLKYAEHCLAQLGCTYAGMSSKSPAGGPNIDAFLQRQGYRPVATYHVKQLGAVHAQVKTSEAA